jgi:rubrerythrin
VKYEAHAVAAIFPMLSEAGLRALADDIKANGQLHPIVLFENRVLDGRNRLAACAIAGVEPQFTVLKTCASPFQYTISTNLRRRQLDESQRAMAAAKSLPLMRPASLQKQQEAGATGGRGKKRNLVAGLPQGLNSKARDQVAEMFDVSPRLVQYAAAIHKDGCVELVAAVEGGRVKLWTAVPIVRLSHDDQRQTIADGNWKEKAKELRTGKAAPNVSAVSAVDGPGEIAPSPQPTVGAAAQSPVPVASSPGAKLRFDPRADLATCRHCGERHGAWRYEAEANYDKTTLHKWFCGRCSRSTRDMAMQIDNGAAGTDAATRGGAPAATTTASAKGQKTPKPVAVARLDPPDACPKCQGRRFRDASEKTHDGGSMTRWACVGCGHVVKPGPNGSGLATGAKAERPNVQTPDEPTIEIFEEEDVWTALATVIQTMTEDQARRLLTMARAIAAEAP